MPKISQFYRGTKKEAFILFLRTDKSRRLRIKDLLAERSEDPTHINTSLYKMTQQYDNDFSLSNKTTITII